MMAQVIESLPPTWETQIEFPAQSGNLILAQSVALQVFEEQTTGWINLSLSLDRFAFQINRLYNKKEQTG